MYFRERTSVMNQSTRWKLRSNPPGQESARTPQTTDHVGQIPPPPAQPESPRKPETLTPRPCALYALSELSTNILLGLTKYPRYGGKYMTNHLTGGPPVNPRRVLKRCFRPRGILNICVTPPPANHMAKRSRCCRAIAVLRRPGSAIPMATWTVQHSCFGL